MGVIWRRWENEKLRLIQLIDLQSMYGYENKTLLQQTGLWLNAVISSRIYCAEIFCCTELFKNYSLQTMFVPLPRYLPQSFFS